MFEAPPILVVSPGTGAPEKNLKKSHLVLDLNR